MEVKEKEKLSTEEQSNIMKAVYKTLKSYEKIKELYFEANNVNGASVGLFSKQGAVYLSKNILGGFKGLVPFVVRYKSSPKTDNARLEMIQYLNDLSTWLVEQKNSIELTNNRIVEKIEQNEITFLEIVSKDGSLTYTATFEMRYRKDE